MVLTGMYSGQSKTGDVLYARELAKRYGSQGLVALSLSTYVSIDVQDPY